MHIRQTFGQEQVHDGFDFRHGNAESTEYQCLLGQQERVDLLLFPQIGCQPLS